jgi:hypothetical protein
MSVPRCLCHYRHGDHWINGCILSTFPSIPEYQTIWLFDYLHLFALAVLITIDGRASSRDLRKGEIQLQRNSPPFQKKIFLSY